MKIIFEDEHDEKLFLEMCRIITRVIEENEKFGYEHKIPKEIKFSRDNEEELAIFIAFNHTRMGKQEFGEKIKSFIIEHVQNKSPFRENLWKAKIEMALIKP